MDTLPFGRPLIDQEERAAVAEVLDGPILVHGPRATMFEEAFSAFSGAPHSVSVSSCTAGMHLIWFVLGLGAGDEVIVPAMTHTATAHSVALTGATPIFVDANLPDGNIDIDAIEKAITPRTKGIAVVHFLGLPVDMPRVKAVAERHGVFLLEDCALAFGTRLDGVHAGLHGDAGVFSFYPVKHMTTAEGGMIITRDADLAKKLGYAKAFGVDRTHGERKIPGVYDVVSLGFNYRMSELHAAIGIEQLKKLPGFLEKREENYQTLKAGLANIADLRLLADESRGVSSRYCLSLLLEGRLATKRVEIMEGMTARGIGTSVYYPHPVPRFTYYKSRFGYRDGSFPNAEAIADRSIALPVGPHLSVGDMRRIVEALDGTIKEIV